MTTDTHIEKKIIKKKTNILIFSRFRSNLLNENKQQKLTSLCNGSLAPRAESKLEIFCCCFFCYNFQILGVVVPTKSF